MKTAFSILIILLCFSNSCKSGPTVDEQGIENNQTEFVLSDSIEKSSDEESLDTPVETINPEESTTDTKNTENDEIQQIDDDVSEPSASESQKEDEEISGENIEIGDSDIEIVNQDHDVIIDDQIEEIPEPLVIHDTWDLLLKKFVSSSGKVNYKGLKAEESVLDEYLAKLSEMEIDKSWSRNKQMAFWINAYNASTVKLILNNFPTSSIMNINGGKAWDVKWIKLSGNTYSLNDIEHKILRPSFNDARIHFAVNCAAKSCPALYNGAWTESNLEGLLESQTKKFINNNKFNTITSNKLVLSKIFEWYKEDFGNLQRFIDAYTDIKIDQKAKLSFQSYDWDLND